MAAVHDELISQMGDVGISPHGRLLLDDGELTQDNGFIFMDWLQANADDLLPPQLFFKKIFADYIQLLPFDLVLHDRFVSPLFDDIRPSKARLAQLAASAPPMLGGENLDAALMQRFFREFEATFQFLFGAFKGDLASFVRSLSPALRNVGKVVFHLAENKDDESGRLPFAFMVSFHYQAANGSMRHLPLASAVKAYLNDKAALNAILEPIVEASYECDLLKSLLESRRIFQAVAWSSAEAYAFLQHLSLYERLNIELRMANLWKSGPARPKVSVSLDVAGERQFTASALLDFSVNVSLGGKKLTKSELRELLASEGTLLRLKGQWVLAQPDKISALLEQWREAERMAADNGLSLAAGLRMLAGLREDKRHHLSVMDQPHLEVQAAPRLRKMLDSLSHPHAVELPPLPQHLEAVLRPYQRDGLKFLWCAQRMGLGACLADDMGLGKTLQLLSLIALWKREGALNRLPVLLVLPVTLLANWRQESAKFTPELKIVCLHPSELSAPQLAEFKSDAGAYLHGYDIALVSYGMLTRYAALADLEFPAVIADEAQAIKNPNAQQSKALRRLKASCRIALTGTPIENKLSDLWSLFDFINRGLLGSLKGFLDFSKSLQGDYAPLRQLVQPFILRRLKSDKSIISDLPDKVEMKAYCALAKRQAALYSSCVESLKEALESEAEGIKRRGLILSYLMRFKQLCNHPSQLIGDGMFDAKDSGKFERLKDLVEPMVARQEKVLVFTQFREMTEPLSRLLASYFGREGLVLHGGTPAKERARMVAAFQEEESIPYFVLSLKAGGTGLNLTAANHVIHFDRWWNPAVENQASDRAYRIGQKNKVMVHKFICKGTLEEKIDLLIESKQHLADELLSKGAESLLTSMSNEELMNLVELENRV